MMRKGYLFLLVSLEEIGMCSIKLTNFFIIISLGLFLSAPPLTSLGSALATEKGESLVIPAPKSGKVYRHPTGISFWYPADWQAQMLSGIMQLVPPGAGNSADSYETYFITAENVAQYGITDPNHPDVLPYLQEQMQMLGQQLGVAFQRNGSAKKLATSQGNGIRFDWSAQSNYGLVKARTYVSIIKGYGMIFAGVGVKDLLERRDTDISQIFSSFGVGEGKLDQRLVGSWRLSSTQAMQNDSTFETSHSKAKMASETESTITFNPDGSWLRTNKSETLVGAGSVWLENKQSSKSNGRWNADQGQLFMLWEDQSFADYQYQLQGNQLSITSAKTRQNWVRVE